MESTVEEFVAQLEKLCEDEKIDRFAPEEIVELLEEGETVGWIVEQVLPAGPDEAVQNLNALLGKIAAQVAPPPAAEEEVEEEGEVTAGEEEASEIAPMDFDPSDLKGLSLPPGVDAKQIQQLMASPRGALLADFGAFCEEKGMSPDEGGEPELNEDMQALHEEWLQTPRESLEGKKPVDMLEGGRLLPQKVETFRREAPKVGRNDPCSCGSGKKYKKCCGSPR